ncbi:hypothetical protein ASPSYDRAFT_804260 [Aspergillus sydowii CBS 593.65]|uniref:Uncharacterized protein n=1 Tax=Aspergillus sydowii CBS 593.65 TaxID=1036612 RepID=A0A1L9TP08_9EURO|nr:uncharacterized protein ASPSYDRAFT_804260 [Aspergillus sydowii CBS 593.65]OJJ61179.1 hypothetical protein ASPSYDRAFT_804260 [Aspergillus sydowii CBS 593.65]
MVMGFIWVSNVHYFRISWFYRTHLLSIPLIRPNCPDRIYAAQLIYVIFIGQLWYIIHDKLRAISSELL